MPLGGVGIQVTFLTPSRDFVGPTLVQEVWSGLTKEDGSYRVPGLLLGSYQVEASLAGFETNFRWVPLRTSADEIILDITLTAADIPGAVQRPPSLPELESREPINEPAPAAINQGEPISPDAQPSPPHPLRHDHLLSLHPLTSLVLQAPGPSVLLFRSRPSRLAKQLKDCVPRYKPLVFPPMSLKPKFLQDPLVTTGCALVRLTLERKPKGWGRRYKAASHKRCRITGSFPTRCLSDGLILRSLRLGFGLAPLSSFPKPLEVHLSSGISLPLVPWGPIL